MRNRVLGLACLAAVLTLVLLGCTVNQLGSARITPTPTKTQRPLFTATLTSTAATPLTDTPQPTETPLPPTDTPVPADTPQPTETIAPPTEAPPTEAPPTEALLPTDTSIPPTDTPIPATSTPAPPTNTPKPKATNTPLPPTHTPKPQVDFRVIQQDIVPKVENIAGLYTIYVRVEDAAGNPLNGLVVWDPSQPEIQAVTGDKSDYYHAEYLMGGGDYYLEVKDSRSEKTKRLTTVLTGISSEDLIKAGYCANDAECGQIGFQHFSWRVVFRRTW